MNDLLCARDAGHFSVVILLDLSAAFDTVDHKILLHRLFHHFGLRGFALSWIKSYLQCRTQVVKVDNQFSSPTPLCVGVPQGSVLGPLLYSASTAP